MAFTALERILAQFSFRVVIISVTVVAACFKYYYALSRPLFISGPDASGFIAGATDFATLPFWKGEISFQPFQPPGYPYFLSFFVRLSNEYWFYYAQVTQITLFAISSIFFYKIVEKLYSREVGLVSFCFFATNPAWFVANGEAMYETLFIFFFLAFAYLLTNHYSVSFSLQTPLLLIASLMGGISCVVHPRALPLTLFFGICALFYLRTPLKLCWSLILFYLFPILIFSIRNYLVFKEFTLSTALWNSFLYNKFFAGCREISCLLTRSSSDPVGFVTQCFLNIVAFFSPNTGKLQIGTWHHNISPVFFLEISGHQFASNFVAVAISLTSFVSWLVGIILVVRKFNGLPLVWAVSTFIIIFTDAIVYGENRHRLIAQIFMLPVQSYLLHHLLSRISRLKNLSIKIRAVDQ
jgi:hypothetical protein